MGEVQVRLSGALDFRHELELRRLLGQAVEECDGGWVVVDLADVTFIDSSVIGTLMECHGRARSRGVVLTVANPSPLIGRWLRLTGVAGTLGLQ